MTSLSLDHRGLTITSRKRTEMWDQGLTGLLLLKAGRLCFLALNFPMFARPDRITFLLFSSVRSIQASKAPLHLKDTSTWAPQGLECAEFWQSRQGDQQKKKAPYKVVEKNQNGKPWLWNPENQFRAWWTLTQRGNDVEAEIQNWLVKRRRKKHQIFSQESKLETKQE
jgi:hypothetical protein